MRLINFGAGEICDRLTILALKILHGTAQGKDVAHWQKEQAVLLTKVAARNGNWFSAYTELAAVNASIWQGEDELREYRSQLPHTELVTNPKELQLLVDTVQIAFRLQELNDRRSELVELINKEVGDHLGSEKL